MPVGIYVPARQNDLAFDTDVGPSPGQGSLFYRGVSKWNALPPAPAGSVLVSGGAGADPVWTPASGTLTGAVILAPGSATRNVIQPTGDFQALTLKAGSTAFSELFTIRDGNGVPVGKFWSDGTMTFSTIIDYAGIGLDLTLESSASGGATGTSSIIQAYPNANTTQPYYGGYYEIKTGNPANFTQPVVGGLFQATHLGAGTIASSFGGWFVTSKNSFAAVTAAYAGNFQVQNNNPTGAIADGVGCRIQSPSLVGAITTSRGIYIQNQGGPGVNSAYGIYLDPISGAATNNYAIYTQGGLHQFGDQLAILGTANRPQLIVRAFDTQSSELVQLINGAGTVVASIGTDGRSQWGGTAVLPQQFMSVVTAPSDLSGTVYGVRGSMAPTPAADSSGLFIGVQGQTVVPTGLAFNFTSTITGVAGLAQHQGSGTVTQAIGGDFAANKSSTGPVTTCVGVNARVSNQNATGTLGTGTGVRVSSPGLTGAITTARGVHIQNVGGANVTNAQGLVIDNQSGATNNNAIITGVGGVSFGDTVVITGSKDATQLTVQGFSTQTNSIFRVRTSGAITLLDTAGNGVLTSQVADAQTNAVTAIANFDHQSSATAANGFGSRIRMHLQSNTTVGRDSFWLDSLWVDATDASRKARLSLHIHDTTNREFLRAESDGTQALMALVGSSVLGGTQVFLPIQGAGYKGLVIRGAASQTANLQEWQNSAGTALGSVAASGMVTHTVLDAATNATSIVAMLDHNSTGTPAATFGGRIINRLQTTTTVSTNAAETVYTWVDATDATRKARITYNVYDTAIREGLRIEADGTQAILGICGAAAASTVLQVNIPANTYKGIVIGNTGAAVNALQTGTGPVIHGDAVNINGSQDVHQFLVTGFSPQTNNLIFARTSASAAVFTVGGSGSLISTFRDAATNNAPISHVFSHDTSGTPANGFGSSFLLRLQSSTTADRDAAHIQWLWATAADASRAGRLIFAAYDSAGTREVLRGEASGTAPMIGFLGANAAVRQTAAAAATDLATVITLANSLRTALINLGLAA